MYRFTVLRGRGLVNGACVKTGEWLPRGFDFETRLLIDLEIFNNE